MIWILVLAGWLVAAPLIAWAMGTAVVLADRAAPAFQLDEATGDEASPEAADAESDAGSDVGTAYQPALAAAG